MGAAGSVEGGDGMSDGGTLSRQGSARGSARSSMRGGRPPSRAGSTRSTGSWKNALKSASLAQSGLRKLRAAALGRKSACSVAIDKTGFSLQHIQICEGQVVTFEWNDPESNGYNVTQVCHDGEQYRPVIGGFNSGATSRRGFYEQQFNLRGEYKFVSAGLRCTPLTVEVWPRKDIEADLMDEGFTPKLIRIDEGNTIRWTWSGCAVPHSVTEVRYSHKSGTFMSKPDGERGIPQKANSYRHDFPKPGMYYYTSEGVHAGSVNACVVHVRERQREYKVEVLDRSFDPPILVIQEGDRVWWTWNKGKCEKHHCVYQVEPPPLGHPTDESYKPYKSGFKWPSPSRSGLMSAEFFEAGVFHYSDHNFQEAAEYLGTIIVKPKQSEQFVELGPDGFTPDLLYAETGDRVWWTWSANDVDANFSIMEIEKCISPVGGRPAIESEQAGGEGSYMDQEIEQIKVAAGLETIQLGSIGVYHYKLSENYNMNTCSVISNPGPRNHTIHVTDTGFEPKVLTVHPRDRVWWIWQEGSKQHNIIQVSHQGNNIANGFCSGAPLECPSAFMYQFRACGVFYYISESLPKMFGAIVVTSQPKVHEVQVTGTSIVPDPSPISINDVVAWTFRGLRQHDISEVHTIDQVLDAQANHGQIAPRRSLNRLFTERGVFHFTSRSFLKQNSKRDRDETRISSILVDDISDSMCIRVNGSGFHPDAISVRRGQSVLWSWKDCGDEAHNIIHVNNPNSDAPLSIIQGGQAFNSGRPVARNSFLYTFDDPGTYSVASQGAPGYAGTIYVLEDATKCSKPFITSERSGGTVDKYHVIKLKSETPKCKIYYTIDGSAPELHRISTKIGSAKDGNAKLYDKSKGIVLRTPGLVFLRAIAVGDGKTNSDIMTSRRFWVLGEGDPETPPSSPEPQQPDADMSRWWNCIPTIKAVFESTGVMEVFWDLPSVDSRALIRGYNLFLNGITYCEMFPSEYNSVSVSGLAGGRSYEVYLEVYPMDAMYLPHKSNKLIMRVPVTNDTAGPVISLERTEKPDAMSIVWMSIHTDSSPIEGYRLYLNGQMCGNQVTPDESSDRCKVVIEGCQLNHSYKVVVAAIPLNGGNPKMSNEIDSRLPLDTSHITLPPKETRGSDPDLYIEYIEIMRGSRKKPRGPPRIEVPPIPDPEPTPSKPEVQPVPGRDDGLPNPLVTAEAAGDDGILIRWSFARSAEPLYRLLVNVVNVIGVKFSKNVNSDSSFECMQESPNGDAIPAVQHCWHITSGNQCLIKGVQGSTTYTIYVVANYTLNNTQQQYEIQAKSDTITYTTIGPPPAPTLRGVTADLYQATLAWDTPGSHRNVELTGYRVMVDGSQLGPLLTKQTKQTVIDNLQPGRTIKVSVIACTSHSVGESNPSNSIRVTCPARPPAPSLSQQPSYKKGAVTVAWSRPSMTELSMGEDVIFYRVYLDDDLHAEIRANAEANRNGYQYLVTDMKPGQSYDVSLKSYSGQRKIDPTSDHVFCLSESSSSNSVPVMCPAPPTSPTLRLDGIRHDGIDVTWDMPQQYGEATVSGFQMMKGGSMYGSIIPPDVNTMTIKGLVLGEIVELQILALTDHPVGRDGDDDNEEGFKEIYVGNRYSACKPGPTLTVMYTGLVMPPTKVWTEQVTGHSAMIVWNKDERERKHYVHPDSYQVTWWPGDKAQDQVNSQATKEDHMLITGLVPNAQYSVVVEARKLQKYAEVETKTGAVTETHKSHHNTFILTAKSDRLLFRSASPPTPASNLGIVATTTNAIKVSWDPPRDRGVDIICLRVDAVAMKGNDRHKHACVEVMSDATSAIVEGLSEKTEYLLTVTAVTEEYFEQLPPGHELKHSRTLSKNQPPKEDPWLPSASVIGSTSGTDAPYDVKIVKNTVDSVTITWKPAKCYGSNRLQGHIVRWAEGKFNKDKTENNYLASHQMLQADSNTATIEDLHPGILYKIVVEAVVSVKTVLDRDTRSLESEKSNRRTTHVMSRPLFVRTRAPCVPPEPIITGYTTNTIQLYWEKPVLYKVIGKDEDGEPKYLKLSLEGYRLDINNKPHMRLVHTAQSCTLIKCKPGKTYKIVLVALTCTEEVKRERKKAKKSSGMNDSNQEWEMTAEDLENDESPSLPLSCTLPRLQEGLLCDVKAQYIMPPDNLNDDADDRGDIQVDWGIQDSVSSIRQFTVAWHCLVDGSRQKKVIDKDVRTCTIPVQRLRTLYNITVNPRYEGEKLDDDTQMVQVPVPGAPDAPIIWPRSVSQSEFIIEWAEPKLFGVKVKGYQVYMNDRKVGNMLNSHHRKAVIPCKARREYKVALVAISANPKFSDSEQSNKLIINTGGRYKRSDSVDDIKPEMDDLPVKVLKVTDSTVHLDWTLYNEVDNMAHYRVSWSSVAQPAEREVKLPAGEKSCVIHKCYPGTNHFIRIYAMSAEDKILDKSRQLSVQTNAPPDTPTVSLRSCNFKYVTVQWTKPSTYGDCKVTGYKVYVNGVVEAVQGPETSSFTYTHGKWCREYVFQVQALTNSDTMNSRPSEPLVVTWPGVQPPALRKAPSASSNSVKVIWDYPTASEGVKIKHYKLVCMEEGSERIVQVISPIHADTCEAELHSLSSGTYLVFVEVHIHGSNEIVKSDLLRIRPMITPDPPLITVTVIGLEERRQIEKVTCDLINKRDRLLNVMVSNSPSFSPRHGSDEEQIRAKAAESLIQVDNMLDDCVSSLEHYTGHLLAHVTWTCNQSNSDVRISGFKVLVDGKQYGTTLHSGVRNVRIKLGLNQPSHRLSMVTVSDLPQTLSLESNIVELLTEPFLSFMFYSPLATEPKEGKLPPTYQETLAIERKFTTRKPINQGLLRRHVPPPACSPLNIFDGEYRPLFPPSGPRCPTAILFWAKWCPSSKKTLEWFVRFARKYSSQYDFSAVCCSKSNVSGLQRHELVHVITQNGWREDSCIRHMTNQSANSVTVIGDLNTSCKWHKHGEEQQVESADICEIFGVQGVPSIIIIHPDDYIAWKGRYCAFDYANFEHYMSYIFAQCGGAVPQGPDPWDTKIDFSNVEGTGGKRKMSDSQMLIHRPTYGSAKLRNGGTNGMNGTLNGTGQRPKSGKQKLFVKTKSTSKTTDHLISVNFRPLSATSPYEQRLTQSGQASPTKKRSKSGKKPSKSTL